MSVAEVLHTSAVDGKPSLSTRAPIPSRLAEVPFAGGRRINFPVLLAPMVGLSHVALRALVRTYLPAGASTLLFTEMLSSRRLSAERVGSTPQTYVMEGGETDLVPQLLANEERFIRESMKKLEALSPAGVDINMGCPVKKALSHNWGVALMGDIGYASEVVSITRRHAGVPLSVKMRSGLSENLPYLVEFIQAMESSGADWVTLHPRLQSQGRRGRASWETIARARESVKIPLVGNGDVQTAEDVLMMFAETGCDGVMVGRAATARPWIFWQVGETLGFSPPPGREGEMAPRTPEEEGRECRRALLFFVDQLEKRFVPVEGIRRLRFFVAWSHKWLPFGHHLWAQTTRVNDYPSARAAIERFFETPHTLVPRTTL
jgi:nifR3 family TIM-barrel protein